MQGSPGSVELTYLDALMLRNLVAQRMDVLKRHIALDDASATHAREMYDVYAPMHAKLTACAERYVEFISRVAS